MATTASPRRGRAAKADAPAVTTPEGDNLALKVVPKRDGFRRAGYAFPGGDTVIPLADLTSEQYEQLTTEPMLVTQLIELPEPAEAATTTPEQP